MLRPLFFMILALTSGGPGATYQIVARPLPPIQAPADEYFGRYRLSSLGVRNAIRDMTIEGDSPLALPLQTERISAVASALPLWADKYPRDPWVPSEMAKFAAFLISKQRPEYDRAALAYLSYLEWMYPRTWYANFAQAHIDALDMLPNIDMQNAPWRMGLERHR